MIIFCIAFSFDLKLPETQSVEGTVSEIHLFEQPSYLVLKTDTQGDLIVLSEGLLQVLMRKLYYTQPRIDRQTVLKRMENLLKEEKIQFEGYFVTINNSLNLFVPTKAVIKDKEVYLPGFRMFWGDYGRGFAYPYPQHPMYRDFRYYRRFNPYYNRPYFGPMMPGPWMCPCFMMPPMGEFPQDQFPNPYTTKNNMPPMKNQPYRGQPNW